MTQENKNLLLKDICERLPYGIKCINTNWTKDGYVEVSNVWAKEQKVQIFEDWVGIEYCKPYLRPMSSMTEEEKQQYWDLCYQDQDDIWGKCRFDKIVDFCLERHLDYRGLIEKGLAIEAPEGMYDF